MKNMIGYISGMVTARAEMRAESTRPKAYRNAVFINKELDISIMNVKEL